MGQDVKADDDVEGRGGVAVVVVLFQEVEAHVRIIVFESGSTFFEHFPRNVEDR